MRKTLDKLVNEGRDLSEASMDSMLKDGQQGKRNTLRDADGSAADELFRGGKPNSKPKNQTDKKPGSSIFDDM